MAFASQYSPGIQAVIPLPALLGHDPHVPIQIATSFLIFEDIPVDPFVADTADTLLLERVADLLGAPFPFEQGLNLKPLMGAQP